MKKFGYLVLGLSLSVLCGATVYNQFSPGGALSGSWNSQNVNLAAGSPFITGILPSTGGGTSNGFTSFVGPATSTKTFTLPNASATLLTTNASVTVPQGGTGLVTLTAHGLLLGEGTSNVSAVAAMSADTLLQGQGTSSDPAAVAVNNCGSSTQALSYSTSTHSFGCQSITAGSAALTATDIGFGSAGNVLTGTANLQWTDSTKTLTIGGAAGLSTITTGLLNNNNAGALTIQVAANTFFSTPGPLTLQASNGSGAGVGGGSINIIAGTSASSTAGSITLQTGGSTRVTVDQNGNSAFTGAINSTGTKFTASGCSNSATTGGAIAGQFTSGTTGTCTVAITLPTAPNGWSCRATDITNVATLNQTAKSTTSCTVSGTTTTNDVVIFSAMGY